jgi:chromosome partitioning protein
LLSLGLADRGQRVAMIDSDPNKPLIYWASLPGRSDLISVHAAPTAQDIPDALREARRRDPDWIVLDTEGSIRGAMVFKALRLDLVITPLAGSTLEALQAIKASELVGHISDRFGGRLIHRCLLTRVPAAIRPRSLKAVVEQLRAKNIEMMPTALIEKEAFRALFAIGGGLDGLKAHGTSGVEAAAHNAAAYVDCVLELLETR